jgi:hypothetical protein
MIDQQTFDEFAPLAREWAKTQEEFILALGSPLRPAAVADAARVGVQDPSRVRVLVVERIPLPANDALAEASRRNDIITDACRGVAIGHGIIIRADSWGDRELLLHQLVHVAQCERCGGIDAFVLEYLSNRQSSATFTVGTLEDEARSKAREICAADSAKQ